MSQNAVRDADTDAASHILVTLSSFTSRAPIGSLQATPETGTKALTLGIQEIRSLDFDMNKLNPPTKNKLNAANG